MKLTPTFQSTVLGLTLLSLPLVAAPSPGSSVPAHAVGPAGISSAGTSGLEIVNLDPLQPAVVVVDFYGQSGGAPVSVVIPPIPPASPGHLYLPARSELQSGAYAAMVSADRQVSTLARTEWPASGGATTHEAAVRFGRNIRSSELLEVVRVEPQHEERTWRIFCDCADKSFGMVDCTSFAVIEARGTTKAFALGRHFRQFGWELQPPTA